MLSLLVSSCYTQQPQGAVQIDWSNSITRGLVFAFFATATGLVGYGSNGANTLPFVATYGAQFGNAIGAAVITPQGYGAKALLAGQPIVTPPDFPAAQSSNFSLFALATGPATGTQSAIDDDDGSTRRYQFRLNAGKVEFIPFSSGGAQTLTVPSALTSAELARGFAMGASAGPGRYAVLQNSQIASATPGGSLLTPTAKPSIGARKSGTQQWSLGGLSSLCNWARTLADAELLSLVANPWQIWKLPSRRLWYSTTSASDATGSLAATLDGATFVATGQIVAQGAFATTLSGAGFTAAGTVGNAPSGTVASILAGASMETAGSVANTGALASTLDGVSMAASGTVTSRGALASTLGGTTLSATGAVNTNASGAVASTLDGAMFAAGGYVGTPPAAPDFFIRLPKNPRRTLRH